MHLSLHLSNKPLSIIRVVTFFFLGLLTSTTSNAQWAFLKGGGAGYWGTRGTSSSVNQPSGRSSFATCTDNSGNIWLFGGYGQDINHNGGRLNDLWKYSAASNEWTWVSGKNDRTIDIVSTYGTKGVADQENVPSVRTGSNIWADNAGNIWIWGGVGYDGNGYNGNLNDLWKYNIKQDNWTWMSGSDLVYSPAVYGTRGLPHVENQPAYMSAAAAADRFGNLWLTGNNSGFELWKYNTATNKWTFLGKGNYLGVYGAKGIPGSENSPGYRYVHSTSTDSAGKLWVFGGIGYGLNNWGKLNDLWQYNPSADEWQWVSGNNNPEQIGIYGTQGSFNLKNHPGARYYSAMSFDTNNSLFLFGGYGKSGLESEGGLNDLWNFNPVLGSWRWISGSKAPDQGTVYGTKGIPSINNHPGGSGYAGINFAWNGNMYLYGRENTNEVWNFIYNIAPKISISSPVNEATYNVPATIEIEATASDPDGTIDYVQFFNGTTLLATDSTSPYSYSWDSVATGNYTITAKAKDNNGAITTSAGVNITVINNIPPSITIITPDSNAVFTAPADITISAAASDSDGTISYVQFFNGTTILKVDSTSPYSYSWTNVAEGNYTIIATAVDNNGSSATSSVNISVVPNKAPVVEITSPANKDAFASPGEINISATASDSDGTIKYVQFFRGTTLLATDSTAPYNFLWSNVPIGNYSITARATDNGGLTSTSDAVKVSVSENKAPSVSIITPDNNTIYVAPAHIALNAEAADSDGSISYVQFYRNGSVVFTDSTSPYSIELDSVPKGNYSFLAKAVDDKGLTSSTASVNVSVTSAPGQAPVVNITGPVANAVYLSPASITINATATDPDGVIKNVKFFNGSVLIATDTSSPYNYTINNLAAGSYKFYVQATDNSNLKNSSSTVVAFVVAPAANKVPVVNITSPANNAKYAALSNIVLTADATDQDGPITSVQFFNGSVLLKTDNTKPYSYTVSNAAKGNYSFVARAIDNNGATSNSATVNVAVGLSTTANKAPLVDITAPVTNTTLISGASIIISASASDPDGTITNVKFFSGSTLLKTDSVSPYNFTIPGAGIGTYKIYAKATDNAGMSSSSETVSVVVVPVPTNKAPVITLASPANNAVYFAPATILLSALASDPDDSVVHVRFYQGSTLVATDSTFPYGYTLSNLPKGSYSITARATDKNGLVSNSPTAIVVVSAAPNLAPVVDLLSPANNQTFTSPATITLDAAASDTDGTVSYVKFYTDSTLLGTDSTAPYSVTINNVPAGKYTYFAKAVDNNGLANFSSGAYVIVTGNPATASPVAIINTSKVSNDPSSKKSKSDKDGLLTMKLAPNPAHNILQIRTAGFERNKKQTISIISASGATMKTIHTTISGYPTQINVSALANGLYVIKIMSNNRVMYGQFVKF